MTDQPSKATLANQVVDKLEGFVSTELKPGDRLPAERELAQKYGVSRTVVREAVRALTTKGLLEVKPRSGVVVSSPSAEKVSQSITSFLRAGFPELNYSKVMEVRLHLEVQIAGLAAERHSEADLRQLHDILEDYVNVRGLDAFVRWDMAFHASLAQATHNELYSLLLDSIAEVLRTVRVLAFYLDEPEESPVRVYRYHRAIYDQVERGSVEGARQAMRDHMAEAEETIMRVMAMQALQTIASK